LSESFLLERGLKNYWGYNSLAWFAPAPQYAVQDPVTEFKTMVRELHAAGIEVILDVVFNHTAEGNDGGPTYSLKGIDNSIYYRLFAQDLRYYENLTGCGNTVNCEHPQVRLLIIECLKHWVEEMHVDGFRFDLAPVLARTSAGFDERAQFFAAVRAEPALAYIKLIAEPWDVGFGGYQLGRFPAGWSEWNDRYRDSMRSFWRGDAGKLGEFAERFAGSSDIFRHRARRPSASINMITAHDGFTLNDLVTYNERHNEANLESNRDGHSHNISWNCGAEGPTDDPAICALRLTQMKNMLATLLLSQGVPMMQAGDEFARTQHGNNNAYCQDNELSWVNWNLSAQQTDLHEFVREICNLRGRVSLFRRDTFLKGGTSRVSTKDVSWVHPSGAEMTDRDWNDGDARALGIKLAAQREDHSDYLLLVNPSKRDDAFTLPAARSGTHWTVRLDSSRNGDLASEPSPRYMLRAHSLAILEG
jgi:glycogen operon protein